LSPLYRQIVKQICPVMHCRYIKWKTHFVKTAQQITQYFFAVRVKKVKKEKEFDVKYILKAFIYILCQNCILKWGVTGFSWTMLLRMSELFNLPIYIRIRKFKKRVCFDYYCLPVENPFINAKWNIKCFSAFPGANLFTASLLVHNWFHYEKNS